MNIPLKIEHIGTVERGVLHIHESSMSIESLKMLSNISFEIGQIPESKFRFYDIKFYEDKNKKNYLTRTNFPFFKPSDTEKIQNAYTYFARKILPYGITAANLKYLTENSHLYLTYVPNLQRYWFYKKYILWVNRNCISQDDHRYINLKVEEFVLYGNEEFQRLKDKLNRIKELTSPRGNKRNNIKDEILSFILKRDREECVACGSKDNLQFDHILPLSKGGSDEPENLRVLCRSCNLSRGNLSKFN